MAMLFVVAFVRSARADDRLLFGVILFGPPVSAAMALGIYDGVKAANDEAPSTAMAWLQVLGAGPQAVVLTGFGAYGVTVDRHNRGAAVLGLAATPCAMLTTALAANGMWTLAADAPNPKQMFFSSTAIGINLPLTTNAIAAGLAGGLLTVPYALTQLVATTPVIAVGVHHLARDGAHRADAAVMTAWSSLLFAHAGLSLLLPNHRVDAGEPKGDGTASGNLVMFPSTIADVSSDGLAPAVMIAGSF